MSHSLRIGMLRGIGGVMAITIQNLGVPSSPPAGGGISSPAGGSVVVRGVATAKVRIGDFDVYSEWDGELFAGAGTLPAAGPAGNGPFDLASGVLYVRSKTVTAPSMSAVMSSPVPVTVQTGTVKAGSVGTHWLVIRGTATGKQGTTFVLLPHPTEPLGRVELWDDESGTSAFISMALHAIECPGDSLPKGASQASIAKNATLQSLVQEAIKRSPWQVS